MRGAPPPPIGPTNSALVLHDMQNDFMQANLATPEMQAVVKKTRELIDLAHSLQMPVIYTRVINDPALPAPSERNLYFQRPGPMRCVVGTPGAEIIDELKPIEGDFVVDKTKYSGFFETKLETILRSKGAWIIIAAGGATNFGVEWLARDARVRDIMCVALRDCTYSGTQEAQDMSLANIDGFIGAVMDQAEVVQALSASVAK